MSEHETYSIEIAGVKRDLRLFEIKPGLRKCRRTPEQGEQ